MFQFLFEKFFNIVADFVFACRLFVCRVLHYMSVIQFDFDVSPLAFRLELKLSECPWTS